MEGYTGSRRAPEPTTPVPASAATLPTPGADDVPGALACPNCRASVRPDQAWCTLCLTPFRAAVPEPVDVVEPATAPDPVPDPVRVGVPDTLPSAATVPESLARPDAATGAGTTEGRSAADQAEIVRRADELLAQLAADPASNPPILPPFLRTKARRTLAMMVGAVALALVAVATMTVLGVVFH